MGNREERARQRHPVGGRDWPKEQQMPIPEAARCVHEQQVGLEKVKGCVHRGDGDGRVLLFCLIMEIAK